MGLLAVILHPCYFLLDIGDDLLSVVDGEGRQILLLICKPQLIPVVDQIVSHLQVVILQGVRKQGGFLNHTSRGDLGQFALPLPLPPSLQPLLELEVLHGIGRFNLLVECHQRGLLGALHPLL